LTGRRPPTNGGAPQFPSDEGSHSVAKPELGLKRQCMQCGAKFYDLNKDPAVCPKCGTPMQASAVTRVPPPVVARARPAAAAEEEPEVEAAAGPEMVSLEDVEAAESGKAAGDEDVDLGEEVATADDTFLEEEEEGEDDVTGLIDGDIEDDEET
jgi:uncharacterized protein (TIGR02300 family)